ncbi:SAM-dependent methyltransferase, partial [Listeria welshimeri]|nr:SAM-dependent methyltransferase [Listeria welshimeri]
VFDPPHLLKAGDKSWLAKKYGKLDLLTWRDDISQGFEECMRVLKINGTLVFKWSDCQINVKNILDVIPYKPLYGNQRGSTHWIVFIKEEQA